MELITEKPRKQLSGVIFHTKIARQLSFFRLKIFGLCNLTRSLEKKL